MKSEAVIVFSKRVVVVAVAGNWSIKEHPFDSHWPRVPMSAMAAMVRAKIERGFKRNLLLFSTAQSPRVEAGEEGKSERKTVGSNSVFFAHSGM